VLLAAFTMIESRHHAPLVPLRIFRSRTLAGANALTVLIGTVAVGMPFVLTLYAQQVLGYSALKFGVSTVVLALGATAGAITGQGAVGKAGFRPVAAAGLALMGAGSLVLTQVSVHGSYFPDIFVGLLPCGLGIGLAFVTATVAALAGVTEHEAGLASGLSNTAMQIGTALGFAIASTVAVSRSKDYLAAHAAVNPLAALTEGYRTAFLACAVLAGIGLALALLLPAARGTQRTRRRSRSRQRTAHRSPPPPPEAVADNTNQKERTEMGKIVVSDNVTLDGVIQDPAGDEGFSRGGWVGQRGGFRGKDNEAWAKVQFEEALGAEALLLGRRSDEYFGSLWNSRSGEWADRLNSMPKYVVSSTLKDPVWSNSTVLKGEVVHEVSKLKQELDGEIVVYASFQLVRTLMEHDLVDELRLIVFPVVLGAGERLFGQIGHKKPMRLLSTRTVGDSLAYLAYELVREA
jgi:dihydrofolate reductase